MKPLRQNPLKKGQFFLTITAGTIPVPLVILAYAAKHLLPYVWIFPVLYLLLALVCLTVPGKLRIAYGVVGMLMFLVPGLLVPDKTFGSREAVWVIGAFYGVQLMLSLQIAGWDREREFPVSVAGYCLVPHGIGQFLAIFENVHTEAMNQIVPWMSASLIIFVGLVMLSMNRSSVSSVAGKRKSTAVGIRRKNTLLTFCLFGLALLASLVPSMLGKTFKFFIWIGDWIRKLRELFLRDWDVPLPTQTTTVPFETEGGGMDLVGKYDPDTAQIVYVIVMVLGSIILLPLTIWALIRIFKVVRRLLQKLWKWLLHMSANASEDYYEDEITDTRDDAQWQKQKRERRERRKAAFVSEQKLTAAERIRRRYQRLAVKHKDWTAASTARENLPAEAAALYERARYSAHPVYDEDATLFRKQTKEI